MPGDASYPSVSLLLHCNGTDGSTTFTDSSPTPKTVTANGNAHVEVDQYKFGTASAVFDGTGDYLALPNDASINNFGTDDFTLECWVYITSLAATRTIFTCWSTWTSAVAYTLYVQSTGVLRFRAGNSTPIDISSSAGAITTNTWYHVAASRASGTTRLFLDGVSQGTPHTGSVTISNSSAPRVGLNMDNTEGMIGYIDEIRITKGVGRYTTNFSAPVAAFPDFAGNISGTVLDDAGDPVARVVRAYHRGTGAFAGNTTSSAVDGSYTLNCSTLDECTVICLDDAGGDDYNDLVLRVTPA